jgi:hypothetical protein
MLWLIRLRWIAAGCLFLVLTAARFLFGLGIPVTELYLGNAVLLAANLAYLLLFRRLYSRINLFIGIQISLDLALLSYLLHFSGGVENPFFVFFVFHMFIAGILLAPRAAYLEAAIALSLFAILLAGEHSGLLPRPFVPGFPIPAVGDAFLPGCAANRCRRLAVRLRIPFQHRRKAPGPGVRRHQQLEAEGPGKVPYCNKSRMISEFDLRQQSCRGGAG